MAPAPSLPTLALSSRSSLWLPTGTLIDAARDAGIAGVDLDLDRPWYAADRSGAIPSRLSGQAPKGIVSLWLPRWSERQSSAAGFERELHGSIDLARSLGVTRVVVDRGIAMRPVGTQTKQALLVRLQSELPPSVRITMALRADELSGTREHLATVGSLRRMGEEWDFDLALDLTGRLDPRWEAEAALHRLKGRLRLVRLALPCGRQGRTVPNRLANRSVAWLLDQSFDGTISLVAPPARWRPLGRAALASSVAQQIQSINDRHRRIFAAPLPVRVLPTRQTH